MTDLQRLIQAMEARANLAAAGAQSAIELLAKGAFERMWRFLTANPGASAREAIELAQVEFGGAFAEALAKAFGEQLQRAVGVAEVRELPVSGMSLSRKLYLHTLRTTAEVVGLVRQHAKGILQARELSLQLYDGYSPDRGILRPLEGRARAELPKALRTLTDDPGARRTLTALQVQGQKQAARLKSQALRAAYAEAFEAWRRGDGTEALRRRLDIAQREKNRFFANRIAQTELHRAHTAQVARELMADGELTVLQVRLNPTHPRPDICDLHALADLWGLGPGCYPKERTPLPPFHPFCRCRLRPRPSLDASRATRTPNGEAGFLRLLGLKEAAAVMGSADRAADVMTGTRASAVINRGVSPEYRLRRVGDEAAREHPLLPEPEPAV